jgi:hypothetical protein
MRAHGARLQDQREVPSVVTRYAVAKERRHKQAKWVVCAVAKDGRGQTSPVWVHLDLAGDCTVGGHALRRLANRLVLREGVNAWCAG